MALVTGWLRDGVIKRVGLEPDESIIVTTNEETRSDGYCETCYSEWTFVIVYVNGDQVYETPSYSSDILEDLNYWLSEESGS